MIDGWVYFGFVEWYIHRIQNTIKKQIGETFKPGFDHFGELHFLFDNHWSQLIYVHFVYFSHIFILFSVRLTLFIAQHLYSSTNMVFHLCSPFCAYHETLGFNCRPASIITNIGVRDQCQISYFTLDYQME